MKCVALLPVPSLKSAARPLAAALLILLLPASAEANRPRIRSHHHVPPNWRTFVAARVIAYNSGFYSGSSSVSFSSGGFSITNFVAPDGTASGVVKTGAGTLTLGGTLTFGGTLNLGTGSSTVSGVITTMNAGNLVLNLGTNVNAGSNTILTGVGTTAGLLTGGAINTTAINGGTLTLNGANTFTGTSGTLIATTIATTTVNAGTLNLLATSGSAAGLGTVALNSLGGVAPVPEPSSALLVLIGAGFLSQRRRRG